MGESYSGIRALADFIRDVTKYQQQTPPVHASAQLGPSTENMSFEEAYVHYNYDPYQAGISGFAGGHGPYYPAGMHSSYGP